VPPAEQKIYRKVILMIVSFHPLIKADKNIICAGREPNAKDLAAIKAARAVILSQGCSRSLYEMARANCQNVFPNYDARFKYPYKIGQIRLFRQINISHPPTEIYPDVASFQRRPQKSPSEPALDYPFVFKLNWGGEGDTVYLVKSTEDFGNILRQTSEFEKSGQTGFMLQEFISSGNKTLRVVVIGQRLISYWRILQNPGAFHTNLSKGAIIDSEAEPELQRKAAALIKDVCRKTGINLAGFDVIFSSADEDPCPMLLEINYFFGRRGIGGSEAYYSILQEQVRTWLAGI
jgi:ribosomal protein S6--L-glutamate ligase